MHAARPIDDLNLPAVHFVHVPSFPPVAPALHEHPVLAGPECEFDGQSKQSASPVTALYFPGIHVVHVPPVEPVAPTLQ